MKRIGSTLNRAPWLSYLIITVLAALDAFISIAVIYPNNFAPVGIQGFTVMIQHLLGISVGYLYIFINAPMLLAAFFVLKKSYTLKNLSYILSFSVMTVVIQRIISQFDLSFLIYRAQNEEQAIIAAVGYGAFFGVLYPIAVWLGGSTGGTDILAALINRFKPYSNTVWVLFSINVGVAITSYFVYGRRSLPVILSILSSLVSVCISDYMLKGAMSALKFEIVTSKPRELAAEIMEKLDRGCTEIPSRGMYSGSQSSILVCVIGKKQRVEMEKIIAKYEGSFGFCSPVKSTYGSFHRY